MIPAPTKQWAMLQMALADFDIISKNPRYCINMGAWHEPNYLQNDDGDLIPVCFVCLAGAVMARTLEAPIYQFTSPIRYSIAWEDALMRLNILRTGAYEHNGNTHCYPVRGYHDSPTQWRIDMEHFMEYLMLFDL